MHDNRHKHLLRRLFNASNFKTQQNEKANQKTQPVKKNYFQSQFVRNESCGWGDQH